MSQVHEAFVQCARERAHELRGTISVATMSFCPSVGTDGVAACAGSDG